MGECWSFDNWEDAGWSFDTEQVSVVSAKNTLACLTFSMTASKSSFTLCSCKPHNRQFFTVMSARHTVRCMLAWQLRCLASVWHPCVVSVCCICAWHPWHLCVVSFCGIYECGHAASMCGGVAARVVLAEGSSEDSRLLVALH